jgi:hypothetical protein
MVILQSLTQKIPIKGDKFSFDFVPTTPQLNACSNSVNNVGTGLASEISTIIPSGSPVRPIMEEVPILKVKCWPNVGPVQKGCVGLSM